GIGEDGSTMLCSEKVNLSVQSDSAPFIVKNVLVVRDLSLSKQCVDKELVDFCADKITATLYSRMNIELGKSNLVISRSLLGWSIHGLPHRVKVKEFENVHNIGLSTESILLNELHGHHELLHPSEGRNSNAKPQCEVQTLEVGIEGDSSTMLCSEKVNLSVQSDSAPFIVKNVLVVRDLSLSKQCVDKELVDFCADKITATLYSRMNIELGKSNLVISRSLLGWSIHGLPHRVKVKEFENVHNIGLSTESILLNELHGLGIEGDSSTMLCSEKVNLSVQSDSASFIVKNVLVVRDLSLSKQCVDKELVDFCAVKTDKNFAV
ncbi:hypothetical protein TSAR_014878, partial [Trichomalopsis sarcophagae]